MHAVAEPHGAMVFPKAMCDDIGQSIASITEVVSDQLFVVGRVGLLWE